jgi:hypothetical protein
MKNKWGKGDPVNLSDLLKITPVANEIIHLSEELGMSLTDVMWIVSQIIENGEEFNTTTSLASSEAELLEEEWAELERDNLSEELDQTTYMVNVKINGAGRFPEIGFKAGINDIEDMRYFFDMILEMVEKLD